MHIPSISYQGFFIGLHGYKEKIFVCYQKEEKRLIKVTNNCLKGYYLVIKGAG
jgi:hypothetical protein